jgi:hypothetical protein
MFFAFITGLFGIGACASGTIFLYVGLGPPSISSLINQWNQVKKLEFEKKAEGCAAVSLYSIY